MKMTKHINNDINVALNQMLDLLKSSLEQCEQQALQLNDKNQDDTLVEAIHDKKRMIEKWENTMNECEIKIDKRTHTTSKDAYPDRINETGKQGSLELLEKDLIKARAELKHRNDLPKEFEKILSSQRSYIF